MHVSIVQQMGIVYLSKWRLLSVVENREKSPLSIKTLNLFSIVCRVSSCLQSEIKATNKDPALILLVFSRSVIDIKRKKETIH